MTSTSYNGTSFHDLAIQGFKEWETSYAKINGQVVKVIVDVVEYDDNKKTSEAQSCLKVNIKYNDYFKSNVRREYGHYWSVDDLGVMTLDIQQALGYGSKHQGYNFKMIAAHEFEHILGLDDAYGDTSYNRGPAPETKEVPINDIMRGSDLIKAGYLPTITDNDYEMMWEAWRTDEMQSFVTYEQKDRNENTKHFKRSDVITVIPKN